MKQLKSLMVAFILLMGISFTSCMGESDPTVGGTYIMKVVETYPYSFVFSNSNQRFTATNSSELMASSSLNLNYGDIVMVAWSYNSDEQVVTDATKEVKVLVSGIQNFSTATRTTSLDSNGAGEPYENATINKVGVINNYENDQTGIGYFNKDIIIIPVAFLAKSDLSKHQFTLVYNASEELKDNTVLTLYLRHSNSEEKPTEQVNVYKAFNISTLVSQFKGVTGNLPTKIKIYANLTDKSASNSLEDAKKELQSYEVDYKFEEEK